MSIEKLFHSELSLAIATVPKQSWTKPVDLEQGFKQGTIFRELHLPFYVGGEQNGK